MQGAAARPRAGARRQKWSWGQRFLALGLVAVLCEVAYQKLSSGREASPETRVGCCDHGCPPYSCSTCDFDVDAAQKLVNEIHARSYVGEFNETDFEDLSEACVFVADAGRELSLLEKFNLKRSGGRRARPSRREQAHDVPEVARDYYPGLPPHGPLRVP